MVRREPEFRKLLFQTGLGGIRSDKSLELRIQEIGNKTYLASFQTGSNLTNDVYRKNEDAVGALYYVCVVVVIYGFGIIMMIGSVINKGKHDKSIYKYIADLDNLKRLEKREEKFKTRLLMQKRRIPFRPTSSTSQAILPIKKEGGKKNPWEDIASGSPSKKKENSERQCTPVTCSTSAEEKIGQLDKKRDDPFTIQIEDDAETEENSYGANFSGLVAVKEEDDDEYDYV
ncbi:DgyrCDS12587 [Dimorphilus gyrociliatus]|uniref:DgyrCDS12587 n=1 Tax=Dimorphilus gyrociliatus TaxID=2664684 RepID=A0A7I8W7Y1_9ANNE|nr:DgyrCDS12587 [Dimorphilus gyrociliatus]